MGSERPDASARDFDVGGATASLYDAFAGFGLLVFAFLIGDRRASRPPLRQARVIVGGAAAVAALIAVVGVVAHLAGLRSQGEVGVSDILGPVLGGGVLGAMMGMFLAWIVLGYVEHVRDETLRPGLAKEFGDEVSDAVPNMLRAVGDMDLFRRGRYYDAYSAARVKGLSVRDAHGVALSQRRAIS